MEKTYQLSVDEKYSFKLTSDEVNKLDEISYTKFSESEKQNISHILHNEKSFSVELLEENFIDRSYTVKVNGKTYKVSVETPLDQLISEMGLSLGNDSVEDMIYAPMPGIILEVNVSKDDEVKQGDFLCVLEAMKMENALTSPRDGVIKAVNITKGDTVDKGKLLSEFKEND